MTTYLIVYIGSAVLALITTPVVIRLARRVGAVDRPGVRTIHERPVPRVGGIAIFLSAMSFMVAVLYLNNAIGERFRSIRPQVVTLLVSAGFIFIIGLIDDLKGLPARYKFTAELVAALALCLVDVRITSIEFTSNLVLPLGGWGYLLTVLWIVGITNAVNLSDGLDGLAAGISAIACAVIAVLAVNGGNVVMAIFALALVGSLSGFLVFNFNPAKIFMGDCGSLFLGFTIAASSVMCMTKSSAIVGLALPALALGIPIFDTLFSMLRRFLEGRSMFAPDRSHFHHRLIGMGLRHRHAVMTIYLLTLLFAGLGLFMMVNQNVSSLVIFGAVLMLLLVLFRVVGAVRLHETFNRLQGKYRLAQRRKLERVAFEDLQLRFRHATDSRQWWQAICEAAEQMEFAWVSLKTINSDGQTTEEIWRGKAKLDMSRIITMRIPLRNANATVSTEFEIAIQANGSLEPATHRASLFSRLLDEEKQLLVFNDERSAVSN